MVSSSSPEPSHPALADRINVAWETKADDPAAGEAVNEAIRLLDHGAIRVAEKIAGEWVVHQWVKKAVLLYFRYNPSVEMRFGPVEWYDKVPLKTNWSEARVRCVPGAIARYGAFIEPDSILMPCFVNIGARIGSGTMIDTWATVGSCAQIGSNCHISGGSGIGGVLEPIQATPVIVEDNVFIGARAEVAEGAIVEEGAVLAMGCYVGASTPLYDATTKRMLAPGRIPSRAVCVPGTIPSKDATHSTYAIIIKKYRDERTDARTALNAILREGE